MARIPALKRVGTCSVCGQTVEIEQGSFCAGATEHKRGRRRCRGGDYSCLKTWFVVETADEALVLATFLAEDTGGCLTHPSYGHSMACGDGRNCAETRRKLSSALATYYLTMNSSPASRAEAA